MTITYLVPAAESASATETYGLCLDLASRPPRLGLVANSFPDARNFVDCLVQSLSALLPHASFRIWQKSSTEPMTSDVVDDVAFHCDGVIAAWGH